MRDYGSAPSLALDCRLRLGESIVWDDRSGCLWWVNIHDGEVWRWDPFADADPQTWRLPERVGALGLRQTGGLVLALESGFALFDPETAALERLAAVESDLDTTRLNDGRVDRQGRFVCGGMDEARPQGHISALYSLSPAGEAQQLLAGVACANSLCWSPSGETLYFTDMPTRRIDAFDYDPASGRLGARRVFADLAGEPGLADGSTVDAEGCLWNAQWGGGKLVRYRPDGGVDREIPLPVTNPTCLAFGGRDLDVLFVTTSSFASSDEARARAPHAGGLLAFRPGVRGLAEARFAG
jgi:L-arabinonolactonase